MLEKKSLIVILLLCICMGLFGACNITNKSWTVTQYGNPKGNPMMCYAITNDKNELMLIDGGYDIDAEMVRAIIEEHDNKVAAWIISHPHPDHVGAFNAIMKNNTDIEIGDIYTIDVNYDRYKETAQDYDRFDVYEEFLAITSKMDNVIYLNENDELEVAGLHMKVLHTWNEHTEGLNVNLLNNGSMMFVLSGEEDSMLFCSDVENETEAIVLEEHLEDLEVDYIQLGHHGNWGMTTLFYDNTNPRGVFFDVSNLIMDKTDGAYDAWQMKEYFMNRGVEIYELRTAPNKIVLE